MNRKLSEKKIRMILILCNAALLLAAVVFTAVFSSGVRKKQSQMELETFCATVDSMKQLSLRYFSSEAGYAQAWAAYVEAQNMDMEQALEYIQTVNIQNNRYAHIVDMDTYDAWSTHSRDGDNRVDCYKEFAEYSPEARELYYGNMQKLFGSAGNGDAPVVLGKYRDSGTQSTVISVGTRVTLRTETGHKEYLLLRLIPVEAMRRVWIFPLDYAQAEVGLITTQGDYVIPSSAMRSDNFPEFIAAYNFQEDYSRKDTLMEQLRDNDRLCMEYRNSRGEMCVWYATSLGEDSNLTLLGYIPKENLMGPSTNWSAVVVIGVISMLLMALDGSYLIGINRRLRETAELANQASQAKTQFLSSMSHDIRTPMNAVLGMTNLALRRTDDPAYVRSCLDKVLISGNHLLTLINDILDISKVESGMLTLNPAPFSMPELVEELREIVEPQAETKGVSFRTEQGQMSRKTLVGDRLRLSQIYLNLLNNGVKYTDAGGCVTFRVEEEPGEEPGQVRLICTVSDNGIGMSEEYQKTMYDSFSRATDSRIDKIQGSGLGLAIAKRTTELMNGTIQCDSRLGEGTTFTVRLTLPAAEDAPEDTHPEEKGVQEDIAGTSVLIAEDNDLNWEIIEDMLTECGVRTVRAENGERCVEMLEAAEPGAYDMVFMDVQMPVMNGREAAQRIRRSQRRDLQTIPIAAMTADAFAEDVHACMEAGMNAHIAKPLDFSQVIKLIRLFRMQQKNKES